MIDPARLPELHRQRARIAEHLAWLDREIARTETSRPPSTSPSPEINTPTLPPLAGSNQADPQDLIQNWVDENRASAPLVSKTGCWAVFAAVVLLGFGGLLIFIVLRY